MPLAAMRVVDRRRCRVALHPLVRRVVLIDARTGQGLHGQTCQLSAHGGRCRIAVRPVERGGHAGGPGLSDAVPVWSSPSGPAMPGLDGFTGHARAPAWWER